MTEEKISNPESVLRTAPTAQADEPYLLKIIANELSQTTEVDRINQLLAARREYLAQEEAGKENKHRRKNESSKDDQARDKTKFENEQAKLKQIFDQEQAKTQQDFDNKIRNREQIAEYVTRGVGVVVGVGLLFSPFWYAGLIIAGASFGVKMPGSGMVSRKKKEVDTTDKAKKATETKVDDAPKGS